MSIMSFLLEQLKNLLLNNIVLSCLASWFCCQIIKTICLFFKNKISNFKEFLSLFLWKTGSMPSSHSSLVASLTMCMILKRGLTDDLTLICLCFYLVVVRDAVGVRRANGEQAKKINEVGEVLKENGIDSDFTKLKEVQGHTPLDVFIGSLIGVIFAVIFWIISVPV